MLAPVRYLWLPSCTVFSVVYRGLGVIERGKLLWRNSVVITWVILMERNGIIFDNITMSCRNCSSHSPLFEEFTKIQLILTCGGLENRRDILLNISCLWFSMAFCFVSPLCVLHYLHYFVTLIAAIFPVEWNLCFL